MANASTGSGKNYVGIDLGTTYSAIAYLDPHGTAVTIPNADGDLTTPSVVLFDPSGQVVVGREAKRAILVEPDRVADCVKRDMGERHYRRKLNGKSLSPASISALILKKLKQDAEARIGPIAGAVITVPAYFDETRRQATVAAGEIAGLRVIDILNEPTAAALAYAFRDFIARGGKASDAVGMAIATTAPRHAAVYDLGGGTFDVTILRIAGDDLTVLATDGDVSLGGCDWDERIVNYAAGEFQKTHGLDPLADPHSYQVLLLAAEEAKRDLSRLSRTNLVVTHAGKNLKVGLTREQFEDLTSDLLYRSEARLANVVEQAGLSWKDIDEVIAVGGSSRMPQVLQSLRKITGQEPNCSLPPGEAIAHGAAIHGAIRVVDAYLARQDKARTSPQARPAPVADTHDDGATEDEAYEIAMEMFDDLPDGQLRPPPFLDPHAFKLDPGENPTEQFDAQVADNLRRVKKQDVNAHSLGVEAQDSAGRTLNAILIPRNSSLPVTKTKRFGTSIPNQARVRVRVLEGESRCVDECIKVCECEIERLPGRLPKGSAVDVTFTYDSSGLLHVHAAEVSSGQSASTAIHRFTGLSDDAIDRAKKTLTRISVL